MELALRSLLLLLLYSGLLICVAAFSVVAAQNVTSKLFLRVAIDYLLFVYAAKSF